MAGLAFALQAPPCGDDLTPARLVEQGQPTPVFRQAAGSEIKQVVQFGGPDQPPLAPQPVPTAQTGDIPGVAQLRPLLVKLGFQHLHPGRIARVRGTCAGSDVSRIDVGRHRAFRRQYGTHETVHAAGQRAGLHALFEHLLAQAGQSRAVRGQAAVQLLPTRSRVGGQRPSFRVQQHNASRQRVAQHACNDAMIHAVLPPSTSRYAGTPLVAARPAEN